MENPNISSWKNSPPKTLLLNRKFAGARVVVDYQWSRQCYPWFRDSAWKHSYHFRNYCSSCSMSYGNLRNAFNPRKSYCHCKRIGSPTSDLSIWIVTEMEMVCRLAAINIHFAAQKFWCQCLLFNNEILWFDERSTLPTSERKEK